MIFRLNRDMIQLDSLNKRLVHSFKICQINEVAVTIITYLVFAVPHIL